MYISSRVRDLPKIKEYISIRFSLKTRKEKKKTIHKRHFKNLPLSFYRFIFFSPPLLSFHFLSDFLAVWKWSRNPEDLEGARQYLKNQTMMAFDVLNLYCWGPYVPSFILFSMIFVIFYLIFYGLCYISPYILWSLLYFTLYIYDFFVIISF